MASIWKIWPVSPFHGRSAGPLSLAEDKTRRAAGRLRPSSKQANWSKCGTKGKQTNNITASYSLRERSQPRCPSLFCLHAHIPDTATRVRPEVGPSFLNARHIAHTCGAVTFRGFPFLEQAKVPAAAKRASRAQAKTMATWVYGNRCMKFNAFVS